jgi:hypothetical protein
VDKADAARRVRALRALGVDPGATVSERSAANDKADELERKYGKAEPPSVYAGHITMSYSEYLAWMYESGDLPPTPPSQPWSEYGLWVVRGSSQQATDLDDIVEEGYRYDRGDYDEDDY